MSQKEDKITFAQKERYSLEDLFTLVRILRSPDGCHWDRAQTHASVRKNLIEETYEVADGIDRDDPEALREELGDYLFEGAFHIVLEEERGRFTTEDVTSALCRKMIARHPHVFSPDTGVSGQAVVDDWEKMKKAEKKQNTLAETLAAVPRTLPALMYAKKLTSRAAGVGFTYESPEEGAQKVKEEWGELSAASTEKERFEEYGDLLLALVNYGRLLGLDAEEALEAASQKFRTRLVEMEKNLEKNNKNLSNCTKSELLAAWDKIKK